MNNAEGLALIARVVGGLVIVLVLIAISARIARRSRHFGAGTDLEIVDRLGISRDNQLAVVRVAGRHLLLGIGPQGVSMLSHLDDAAAAVEPGDLPMARPVEHIQPDDQAQPDDEALPDEEALPVVDTLPEEVAAQLLAQFEALARQEEMEAAAEAEEAEAASARGTTRAADRPRRRHADPEPEPAYGTANGGSPVPQPATGPDVPEVRLPGALNLDEYPDLASALRAAGRTTGTGSQSGPPSGSQLQELESALPGSSSWIPAQRRVRDTDLSHATSSAPVAPSDAAPEDGAVGRRRDRSRRVPSQQQASQQQAGGSVLSPGTWRQGIEALREYTVRRG